jgi:glutamine amidotransferase
MRAADVPRIVDVRLSGGRPVLGICVGMQALFESSTEPSDTTEEGLAQWPGVVERLRAPVVPHMGWSEVEVPTGSVLFDGVESERFYFVHSYAVRSWSLPEPTGAFSGVAPRVTHATHGERFVAAVENGPLSATQFHPEKSGDAGAVLLRNWVESLR